MSNIDWDLTGFDVGVTAIPVGVTNAVLLSDPPYTRSGILQYVSGGTLLLMRAPGLVNGQYGATYAGATLAAMYNSGKYAILGNAPLAYNGACRYYMASIGSTATVQYIRGLDAGYPET